MNTTIYRKPDPSAWQKAYYQYLFSFSMNRLKDRQKSEDMVQDTFLKALKKIDQFTGACSERTWLTAILKNNIYDLLRREARILPLFESEIKENDADDYFLPDGGWKAEAQPIVWEAPHTDTIEKKELSAVVGKCIKTLPDRWASAVNLKYLEDEDADRICDTLKITSQNFWTIIHRAKLKLRSCMERFWVKY